MSSKLREALNKIGNISAWVAENCNDQQTAKYMNDIIAIVQESVAEPVRNCDVGTAEEQEERYIKLKREHVDKLLRCPAQGYSFFPDSLYWSQMPYEPVKQTTTKTNKGE